MTLIDWILGNGIQRLQPHEFLYKTNHIITLILVALTAITLSIAFRKNKKMQKITLHVAVGTMLFFEIASRIITIIKLNSYTFENLYKALMPCHFCSIVVVTLLVAFYTKYQPLLNASVVAGFLATIVFLLYPSVGFNTNIITFSQTYSIVSHSLGFILSVLLVVYKKVDFSINKIHHTIIYFAGAILYMLFLNIILFKGSNYGYFVENELGLDVSIHVYRLVLLLIISFEIACCYLPPLIKKTIKKKKNKQLEN